MSHPALLVPAQEAGLALFDSAALRALEATQGDAGLMERAGLAVARLVRARWPAARRIAIVCGPGNNGGDGLVAARHLAALGLELQLVEFAPRRPASPERLRATEGASALPREPLSQLRADTDLIVDALLGLGLRDAPAGELAAALEILAAHPAPKLAVDLPSGLNAQSGHAPGVALRCTATLGLLAPSLGLFTGDGRELAGELWLDRLGCSPPHTPAAWTGSPRAAWTRWSPRALSPHAAHKGSAGQVWVLQGAPAMAGAAQLAARAALASGAGRVYLCEGEPRLDPGWPELMHPAQADRKQGVGVVGCGGGADVGERLLPWLEQASALVLDADGLNAVARSVELQNALRARETRHQRTVITPHPLEAARLLGLANASAVQQDRVRSARQLAERFACTVLLKGSGSVIATAGETPHINCSGHAALATAGTGDVLAGWLGGLMAQAPKASPHELTSIACAWAGDAADQLPPGGGPLRAARLVEAMAALYPAPA